MVWSASSRPLTVDYLGIFDDVAAALEFDDQASSRWSATFRN
jgi:hypothetical protein